MQNQVTDTVAGFVGAPPYLLVGQRFHAGPQAGPKLLDYFLAGVAGRGFTRDYWQRILGRLQPATVVPTHYDDFFKPLDAPDPGLTTNVNLAKVPEEIAAVSRDFEVAALPMLGTAGGS